MWPAAVMGPDGRFGNDTSRLPRLRLLELTVGEMATPRSAGHWRFWVNGGPAMMATAAG